MASSAIDAADAVALVEAARALKQHGAASTAPLRGRNIALLSAAPNGEGARRFDAAATSLGARVARIEPASAWLQDGVGEQTARVLEGLYDCVVCQDVPHGFAQRLQTQLRVPVYDGLGGDDHPIARLLPDVAGSGHAPDDEDWQALLQAALVGTLA